MEDIRHGTCPLCRHNEVLKAVPQGPDVPLFVTLGYEDDVARADSRAPAQQPTNPKGVLVVYACRRCGFAQFFATLPHEIPVGGSTELIKGATPSGPYR